MPALRDVKSKYPSVDPTAIIDDVYLESPPARGILCPPTLRQHESGDGLQ